MAKKRQSGTVVKISMPVRLSQDRYRKTLVEDIARILRRNTLSQYTPVIKIECGKHKKLVEFA